MNHCYVIEGKKKLEKKIVDEKIMDIKIIEDAHKEIAKLLKENTVPNILKYNGVNISSYISGNTKYIQNPEYLKCKEILEKFDLSDKLTDDIKLTNLFGILEKKYLKGTNLDSFFPECNKFNKKALVYKNTKKFSDEELVCIDKNKAYASVLMDLPFLISVDMRSCEIFDWDNSFMDIIDHYLYYAIPEKYTELMEETNLYSGHHLLQCKEAGVKFKIIYGIETKKNNNVYKELISDMFNKIDDDSFKQIMVRAIGCFEIKEKIVRSFKPLGIFNDEEILSLDAICELKIISKKYTMCYQINDNVLCINNKKPISIQIKDQCKVEIYKKMKELKLTEDNLCMINTDSILYKGELPDNLDSKKLGSWKVIKNKGEECKKIYIPKDEKIYIDNVIDTNLLTKNKFRNTLCLSYAGSGKTTYIKDKIIPKLKGSYIILSPSHKSLKEFKQLGLNCSVIQKYIYSNTIPTEETIIIDEFGMFGHKEHDILFKVSMLNKKIYAIGDNNQLSPVNGRRCNNKIYLDMMFSEKIYLTDNHRNNFTKEYYDKLIDGKFTQQDLIKEVNEYGTINYSDAEQIICYRRETVDLYNKRMLKKLKLNKDSVGARTMCITNNLGDDIYNSFTYLIKNSDKNFVTLEDEDTGEIKIINKKTFDKVSNFMPCYATTLHKLQGSSLSSYYYAPEDSSFINNTVAYTTISRLKTK